MASYANQYGPPSFALPPSQNQPGQQQQFASPTGNVTYQQPSSAQQQQQQQQQYHHHQMPHQQQPAYTPQGATNYPPAFSPHQQYSNTDTFALSQQNLVSSQQQHQRTPAPVDTPAPPPPRPMPVPASRAKRQQKQRFEVENSVLLTNAPDEETEDGRIRNREAIGKIRDTWIYKQVRARQHEFTNYKSATVFVGTWNVNAKGKEEPLDEWLCVDWGRNGMESPDIVTVGFQEIVDLNAVNVAVDNKTQQRSQFWVERLRMTLNSGRANDSYVLLAQKSLVGLLICVFVKSRHQKRVRYVTSASVGVGVLGIAGNKGGVSIRLQFYDTTLCFVCAHMAAHRENVTGRNADFANVYAKTVFEIGEEAIREVIRSGSLSHWELGSSAVRIIDHDVCVWLGDLNYRIEESMMTEQILKLSEKKDVDELRSLDQLNIERAAGRVFDGFEEGHLNFPPTYKYQPGTDMYEQRPDKKLRAPAWCDRILWTAQEPDHVTQLTYFRSERPNVSDHKPVYSTFKITIKDVVQQKREAIYEELMKLLDRFENHSLPMVGLDRASLDFGDIQYNQSVTLPIQITNTGSVIAQCRFVPKLDEVTICKRWMKVEPTYGMLIPGEKPLTFNFTISIDNKIAQLLNSGREVLDDILILRLENGRDYYISVKATYARSCFGMSAEELVMYSEPIRKVPLDPIKRAEMIGSRTTTALCVPKELWRIIDAIFEKGLKEPHLFVQPGLADEVNQIRECLDTGSPFARFHVHSYAEVLVSFLESLSVPIIPSQLFPTAEIDSMSIQAISRRLLEDLSPIHYNIFVYVISFFREVLVHSENNLLTAVKIARICCSCLAPGNDLDGSSQSLQKRTGMQMILLHLLETSSI